MATINITTENFDRAIASGKTVLVDFWAPWCGPCRMIAPILEEVANEKSDVLVLKVNVDEEPKLASRFGIHSIPTLLIFKNGQLSMQKTGFHDKEDILSFLK